MTKTLKLGGCFGGRSTRRLNCSFTKGMTSGLRSDGGIIQTDVAINPGNSGDSLIDKSECVIGINTFILENSEGLNFAISSKSQSVCSKI